MRHLIVWRRDSHRAITFPLLQYKFCFGLKPKQTMANDLARKSQARRHAVKLEGLIALHGIFTHAGDMADHRFDRVVICQLTNEVDGARLVLVEEQTQKMC